MSILKDNLAEDFSSNMAHAQCWITWIRHGVALIVESKLRDLLRQVRIEDFNASMVKKCLQIVDLNMTGMTEKFTSPYDDIPMYLAEAELIFDYQYPQCVDIRVKDLHNEITARIYPRPTIDEKFTKDYKNSITQIDNERLESRTDWVCNNRYDI